MGRGILRNVYRRQTREAGARELAAMKPRSFFILDAPPVFVKNDLPDGQRSWADEAHFAAQYVDDLRQFVHAARAQNASHAGNALIILLSLFQPEFFVGVRNHCAELENHELLSESPPPPLAVEDRAAVFELNGDG